MLSLQTIQDIIQCKRKFNIIQGNKPFSENIKIIKKKKIQRVCLIHTDMVN